jgi:hypothetical protein
VTPGSTSKALQNLVLTREEHIHSIEAFDFSSTGKLQRLVFVTNKRRVAMGIKPSDKDDRTKWPVAVIRIPETQCVAGVCGRLDASSGGIASLHVITETLLKPPMYVAAPSALRAPRAPPGDKGVGSTDNRSFEADSTSDSTSDESV